MWKDYELIDCSKGEKLERWGNIYLLRPDPQVIWDNGDLSEKYNNIHARYIRSSKGGGSWENLKKTPLTWEVTYKNLIFNVKQMGFKHTGIFPEQSANWDFMMKKIKESKNEVKVLNLFAYTGGATLACLSSGAHVTHVDSSKGMVEWAKENVRSSRLDENNVRYIVEDVLKFVNREIRRGNTYDAIIMDPPSYGKGTGKEVWNIEKDLFTLVKLCRELLSDKPLFFIINSYTSGLSKEVFNNIVKMVFMDKYKGKVYSEELNIPIRNTEYVLPCGIATRMEFYE